MTQSGGMQAADKFKGEKQHIVSYYYCEENSKSVIFIMRGGVLPEEATPIRIEMFHHKVGQKNC